MNRVLQVGALVLLTMLMVQPDLVAFACVPPVDSIAACGTCPSSMDEPGECPQMLTAVVQGQHSCCQLDVQDTTQQVLVDRFTRDRWIGYVVIERPLPRVAVLTLPGLESDHGRTVPLPAASLQSLYCSFLI